MFHAHMRTCFSDSFLRVRLTFKRRRWARKWFSSFAPTIGGSARSSGRAIFNAKVWRKQNMCVICMCAVHILLFLARGRRKRESDIDILNSILKPDGHVLITSMQALPSYDAIYCWLVACRRTSYRTVNAMISMAMNSRYTHCFVYAWYACIWR